MKKFLALVLVLVLGINFIALAVESPVLLTPPVVSEVAVDGVPASGIQVILEYNEHTQANLAALKQTVAGGQSELSHFALPEEDAAKVAELGFDPATVSVDDLLHATVVGYDVKPASITFKATPTVPYAADAKVLVLMGVGPMPGPFAWSVHEAVVNADGSLTITLANFPAEPFMLALLS